MHLYLNGAVCTGTVMVLMRPNTLLGQVGGSWALEIENFLVPKWHLAKRRWREEKVDTQKKRRHRNKVGHKERRRDKGGMIYKKKEEITYICTQQEEIMLYTNE